jgi:hypothetical protein
MPFPLAISGVTTLATTALNAWNRMTASSSASTTSGSKADFQALLNRASLTQSTGAGSFQKGVLALPEVKAALASTQSGTPVQITLSADGSLSQSLPGGTQQGIPLSTESQAFLRQWNEANPGAFFSIPLIA